MNLYSIYFPLAAAIPAVILTAACISLYLLYRKYKLDNKNLKKQLKAAVENCKKSTDFFTDMTHELKTPLSVILGAIQLIEMQTNGKHVEEIHIDKNLKIIRCNCYRLLRLVNNLLDLAKFEAGYMKFKPVNCNLDNFLSEVVQSVTPYAIQKQLLLLFNKPAEPIITVVDVEKMERIMLNLLSNAIKFTPSGGTISISAYMEGEKICISVKDTGSGIPLECQEEIFEKFRQTGTNPSNEGSGIGLSLVKSYIDLHKGDVSIISEYGKGSEFIITLPVMNTAETFNEYNGQELNSSITEAAKIEFSTIHSASL